MERDVVCGMDVDPKTAPAKSEYQGKTYYSCAPGYKKEIRREPCKVCRTMFRAQWVTVWFVLLLAGLMACTGNDRSGVEKARDFEAFDVWWLGDEFEGLELSSADESAFLYGTCKPSSDAGCAPPAQVIVQELCSFAPLDFEPSAPQEAFRGATFLPVRDGQALLRTGTVAITLFGRDDAMTRRMAERLESLNLEPDVGPGEPMPAPISCDRQ